MYVHVGSSSFRVGYADTCISLPHTCTVNRANLEIRSTVNRANLEIRSTVNRANLEIRSTVNRAESTQRS